MKLFPRRNRRVDPGSARTDAIQPLRYVFPLSPNREGVVSLSGAYEIPVLVIKYFPTRGGVVDRNVTGDVGAPLEEIRRHTEHATQRIVWALETGSTYHGYKDRSARPALRYRVVDTIEFLEPLPTWRKAGHRAPMTDYVAIMDRVGLQERLEGHGVREVWIWGYHGGVVDLWESNMAGPYGDISNSDRDVRDLPVLAKTYTVYHYNYQRGISEAVEDHMHQIEAVLGHVDPHLFWDRFVGRSPGGRGGNRCGWSHYPPNAERDYDWANPRFVSTDIEDWTPDGTGRTLDLNSARWGKDSLTWFLYWMQNIPGADSGLTYRGRRLTNWWRFIGDFDDAMGSGVGLVEPL